MSQTSPKSYNQILNDMFGQVFSQTSIEDIKTGSVVDALIEAENLMRSQSKRINLIRFLSKLDGRFRKHANPWTSLEIAQRYYSKL